eukprot:CAMPEP_0201574672 /NCGR_PEP_ID=MMETSP0190_2-20130828/19322_1 /ASSEMBLY_ACC=CAM_ASM_000263 /TAXON_ID=37353 /ORGANISM="Rosalina sp." /LENGTH=222 /DNA_ID=CAMNT_0048003249 /DNA_START=157 /DNA_END=821 /DNA_ORIENTATION=+
MDTIAQTLLSIISISGESFVCSQSLGFCTLTCRNSGDTCTKINNEQLIPISGSSCLDEGDGVLKCGVIVPPPTTAAPTTADPTTASPTTSNPTSSAPTTSDPTTASPTTATPTSASPTTANPTSAAPTTSDPTTASPTTANPTTSDPTTAYPTSASPTTSNPTSAAPTTANPTTSTPTTTRPKSYKSKGCRVLSDSEIGHQPGESQTYTMVTDDGLTRSYIV